MQKYGLNELKNVFRFFASKDHLVLGSFSLVPTMITAYC